MWLGVQSKELGLGTVPPGASLVYTIELVHLEKVRWRLQEQCIICLTCTLQYVNTTQMLLIKSSGLLITDSLYVLARCQDILAYTQLKATCYHNL